MDLKGSGELYSRKFRDEREVSGQKRVKEGLRGAQSQARQGWGPPLGVVWCSRAPSRLRFRLVIPYLVQKHHKQKSKSNTRTFSYQNCYLFKNRLCRFLKLVFNEFLRSHNFRSEEHTSELQ